MGESLGDQAADVTVPDGVDPAAAARVSHDQAAQAQPAQMLGHRRPGYAGQLRQFGHVPVGGGEHGQQPQPSRVRQEA